MRNVFILLALTFLAACSKPDTSASNKVPEHFGNYYEPKWEPEPFDTTLKGVASYYGQGFQGNLMANGKPFDKNKLTVAHKTIPFGTKLKVTNKRNGKSVVVTVTDRGPFIKGRHLDLSERAFREIADTNRGIIKVKYNRL